MTINSSKAFFLAEQTFDMHRHAQNTESKNTLQVLQSVEFVLKRNSVNIPKLECQRSIDITRV